MRSLPCCRNLPACTEERFCSLPPSYWQAFWLTAALASTNLRGIAGFGLEDYRGETSYQMRITVVHLSLFSSCLKTCCLPNRAGEGSISHGLPAPNTISLRAALCSFCARETTKFSQIVKAALCANIFCLGNYLLAPLIPMHLQQKIFFSSLQVFLLHYAPEMAICHWWLSDSIMHNQQRA